MICRLLDVCDERRILNFILLCLPSLVMKAVFLNFKDDKLIVYQSKKAPKETIVIQCLDSKNAIFPYAGGDTADYEPTSINWMDMNLPFVSMDFDPNLLVLKHKRDLNFLAATLPLFPLVLVEMIKNMVRESGMIFKLVTD